jgi:flagellar hook-associated protein 2
MSLTLSGIGSGLDIQGLVKQLVQAEGQAKNNALNRRESSYKTELSALGTLKSSLSNFKDAAAKLADSNDLLKVAATSGDEAMLTASASSSAAAGEYSMEVLNLAKAQKLSSTGFSASSDTVGTGTLTISSGGNSFEVVIDSSNSSLAGIRDAINASADNNSVTATIVNVDDGTGGTEARLVLTSKETGIENQIGIQVTEDSDDGVLETGLSQLSYSYDASGVGSGGMSELVAAENAQIRVDGMLATRSSNSISDVIPGVTLDLKAETTSAVNLSLRVDKEGTKESVQAFVDSYNELADTYKRLTAYNADTESGGALQGDFSARQIMGEVRSILRTNDPSSSYGSLFSIGIEIDQYGKMSIDSTKFDEVLSTRPEALSSLLSSADGIAGKLEDSLKQALDPGGIFDSRTKRLDQSIKKVGDERLDLEDRLQTLEKRMLNQFIAMDTLVAQYNNTGNYLAGQLANLPGFAPLKSK